MSTLQQRAESIVGAAKRVKQDVVAARGPDGDVRPMVIAWRGHQEVVTVHTFGPMRGSQDVLPLVRRVAISFRADCLALVNEMWHSTTDIDPDTGKGWAPGAMSTFVERHGVDNGVTRESLQVAVVNAGGDLVTIMQPFTVRGSSFGGHQVIFDDPLVGDASSFSGLLADSMVASMQEAAGFASHLNMIAVAGGTDPETADAASDAAAVKNLHNEVPDIAVLLTSTPDQTARNAYLEKSLGQPLRDTLQGAWDVMQERQRRGEG